MPASPAVVLLHGQPGSRLHWRRVCELLPDDITTIADDRPGYGHSTEPATGLAGNADAVIRRLDELGVERAVAVGHSWAGGVCLALADRYPDRTAAAVLVSSIGPGAVTRVDRALTVPVLGDAASWVFSRAAEPVLRRKIVQIVGDDAEVTRTLELHRKRRIWRTFLEEQRTMVEELPSLVERLSTLVTPAVVITGSADRVVRPSISERLADRLPNAELRVVPGAGHALPLTDPGPVAAAATSLVRAATRV